MQRLDGQVAVVTGAASGIGLALATRLCADGMRVVLADIDTAALERATATLRGAGHDVIAVTTDVARLEDVQRLADQAIAAFGRVHLLCNNAGVTRHTGQPLWMLTDKDWRWLLGVNVWSVIHALRVFIPHMIAHGEPAHVVNTASMAGLVAGTGAYGATRHAVVSLSESLLLDLRAAGAAIGVSCLCPGLVATNIVDSDAHRPNDLRDDAPEDPRHAVYRREIAIKTAERGVAPATVAEIVVDGVRADRFWLFTSDPDHTNPAIQARTTAILDRADPKAPPRP